MKIAFFSSKPYDQNSFNGINQRFNYDLVFLEPRLSLETAPLAAGFPVICAFINDDLSQAVLEKLAHQGTRIIALRCAGFNNINLEAARRLGLAVVRVPAYSPYAVAEHAVGLILMLNRKLYRAYNRVRDDNFSLVGLLGFDLHGKTVGIIGTGKIGECFAKIMRGFGCELLAYDPQENPVCLDLGVQYTDLKTLLSAADIISLHCPLVPDTYHLINETSLGYLKPGAMLINTSRGGLIDTRAVIEAIKTRQLGYFGTDVYEEEENLFFEDLSDTVIQDDTFQLLQSFPNVVITAHQAFFTQEALGNIATTTLENIHLLAKGEACPNQLCP
ncbi:2-hydroxyacid dehydrogenase [Synechococcus moorigangaii CMS01]|nr:2-hydroxyacid dehydrogenase [Synechococcus moorigangaii CMS01]